MKRKGLDFTCCGMVDAQAAKRLRLPIPKQDAQADFPVSVAMIDEWEAFRKSFRCAVQAHTDCGDLDLGVCLLATRRDLMSAGCACAAWACYQAAASF